MNNDDERDYQEEEYNRRTMREEGESELAAERAEKRGMWAIDVQLSYSLDNPRQADASDELLITGGTVQLANFYLNPVTLGITGEAHAKRLAHRHIATILYVAGVIGWNDNEYPVTHRIKGYGGNPDRTVTPHISALWVESDGLGGPEYLR